MRIAIVGHGFVGKAVEYGFSSCTKHIIDPLYGNSIQDLQSINPEATFVCVPTPMSDTGAIDSSILEEVVTELQNTVTGLIVIKSTATPDIIQRLTQTYGGGRVVYNPEFLTEKNACQDFVNPPFHIFGGDPGSTKHLEKIYNEHSMCLPCPSFHVTPREASFIKYGINTFLASKVLWFNQFKDIVDANGCNFNRVIKAISADDRVGASHILAPGFDGKKGYGGACFPKDTAALANFAGTFSILEKVIEENNLYRSQYEKDDREKAQNVSYTTSSEK